MEYKQAINVIPEQTNKFKFIQLVRQTNAREIRIFCILMITSFEGNNVYKLIVSFFTDTKTSELLPIAR